MLSCGASIVSELIALLPIITPIISKLAELATGAMPTVSSAIESFGGAVKTVVDYFNAGAGDDGLFGGLTSAVAGVMVALGASEAGRPAGLRACLRGISGPVDASPVRQRHRADGGVEGNERAVGRLSLSRAFLRNAATYSVDLRIGRIFCGSRTELPQFRNRR